MEWLGNNWIWILVIGGLGAMHLFGHRGHGSGHKHGAPPPDTDSDAAPAKVPSVPHNHGAPAQTEAADPKANPAAEPANALPTEPETEHKHES